MYPVPTKFPSSRVHTASSECCLTAISFYAAHDKSSFPHNNRTVKLATLLKSWMCAGEQPQGGSGRYNWVSSALTMSRDAMSCWYNITHYTSLKNSVPEQVLCCPCQPTHLAINITILIQYQSLSVFVVTFKTSHWGVALVHRWICPRCSFWAKKQRPLCWYIFGFSYPFIYSSAHLNISRYKRYP